MSVRERFTEGGAWSSYGNSRSVRVSQLDPYPRTREIAGRRFLAFDAADPRVRCLLAADHHMGPPIHRRPGSKGS